MTPASPPGPADAPPGGLSVVIPALDEAPLIGGAVANAFAAGACEVIVADGGSADGTAALARAEGLHLVYLLAPTSTGERIAAVAEHGSGFVYCVSVTGVTGSRARLSAELPAFVARVRERVPLPLAVGFGISAREHVEAVGAVADGAIVGSAVVQAIREAPRERRAEAIRALMERLRGGRAEGAAPR